jgi:hypothetical protein
MDRLTRRRGTCIATFLFERSEKKGTVPVRKGDSPLFFRTLVASGCLLMAGVASLGGAGERPAKQAAQAKLAKELIGTWVLVATPDKDTEPPKAGGRLRFFSGKHWCITQADAKTGKVIYHHGGTYTLDGDTYTETVKYATANTEGFINKTFKFKITVEGDTYTQTAVGADNPFTEVWKRVK